MFLIPGGVVRGGGDRKQRRTANVSPRYNLIIVVCAALVSETNTQREREVGSQATGMGVSSLVTEPQCI